VTDYHHARLVRFGSNALEPSHALARKRTDLSRDVLRYRRGSENVRDRTSERGDWNRKAPFRRANRSTARSTFPSAMETALDRGGAGGSV
jgi:hypothetical protein